MLTLHGSRAITLRRAAISLTASGVVVGAVVGRRIKVYGYTVRSRNDAMSVQFTDGNGGPNLSGVMLLNAREKEIMPPTVPDVYHFATKAGTGLFASIGGVGTVDIDVMYWDEDAA